MNPLFVTRGKTPKGVRKFQPRATPWEPEGKLSANSERVRELNPRLLAKRFIRELLQSSGIVTGSFDPGRCPGLEFANASGVLDSSSMLMPFQGRVAGVIYFDERVRGSGRLKIAHP